MLVTVVLRDLGSCLGGVSAILVILQATVVGHWCFLCLVTAVISLLLIWWAFERGILG